MKTNRKERTKKPMNIYGCDSDPHIILEDINKVVRNETVITESQVSHSVDLSLDESNDFLDTIKSLEIKSKQNSRLKHKFCGFYQIKDNKHLYDVEFNPFLPKDQNYFVTVGGNRVTVFECLKDDTNRLVHCYSFRDKSEDLYCCVWSFDDLTGNPLIITAGVQAVIRIIDCSKSDTVRQMTGHGRDINELKISPHNKDLLLSSSKDYSLRLWNIKTGICIAKFGGDSGHRDQVISADFHLLSDKYIISSGMDHSMKIWSIDKNNIRNAINESFSDNEENVFKTECEHFPCFTTRDIHNKYVDCVRFFGSFVLSKSLENEIICWKPKNFTKNGFPKNQTNEILKEVEVIDRFPINDCEIWFIRFSTDESQRLLSVGNMSGVTSVWDLEIEDPFDVKPLELIHPKCKSAIRKTCFSSDGSILIAVCEDSTIWRWNIIKD